jgi:glucose/mannose transport system substrate-binding protein
VPDDGKSCRKALIYIDGFGGVVKDGLASPKGDISTLPKVGTFLSCVDRESYTDKNAPGRDWNLATAMVIKGEAGMQLMGDWAKGEFLAANKVPGKDFVCTHAPGTASAFTFNIDSFAMFRLKSDANVKAQKDLAAAILSPEFQEVFNLNKGSIPVRLNMDMAKFDECAKLSAKDFVNTSKSGALVPSIAHGMAVPPAVQGAIQDAVSQFWNDDRMTVATAQERIARAAQTK